MNRKERRKLSRHATTAEIFPEGHKPIPSETQRVMISVMHILKDAFPGFEITMFLAEKKVQPGQSAPRFNYMSTADRRDMIAVLRAFIEKHEAVAPKLERFNEKPPTETPQ